MIKRLLAHDFLVPVILVVIVTLAATSPFIIVVWLAEMRR